ACRKNGEPLHPRSPSFDAPKRMRVFPARPPEDSRAGAGRRRFPASRRFRRRRLTVPMARGVMSGTHIKEAAMVKRYNIESVNNPQGRFSHVGEIGPNARLFHLAGQTGARPDGTVSQDFAEQARQVYRNLTTVLA